MLTDIPTVRTLLAIVATIWLAACAMSASEGNPQEPASVEKRREVIQREREGRTPARVPAEEKTPITGEVPAAILNLFIDDLTLRAVVRREAITVIEAIQRDWPDGSLGCASPGTAAIQVIIPGYRVKLSANGQAYAYHSDLRGRFVLCDSGIPLPPAKRTAGDKPPAQ